MGGKASLQPKRTPVTEYEIESIMEYSLWTRDIADDIIPICRELGIGIVAYSPLDRGFFGGKAGIEPLIHREHFAIDAPGEFLIKWWSVFWDIFIASTNDKHSESAATNNESKILKTREAQQMQQQKSQQQQMQMQQILMQRQLAQQQQQQQLQQGQPQQG